MRFLFGTVVAVCGMALWFASCSKSGSSTSDGATSEIAAGSLGGTSNDNMTGGTASYASRIQTPKESLLARAAHFFTLLPEAFALKVTCSGGTMSPSSYNSSGNITYQWTPISCSLTFRNGKSASVAWSSYFNVNYSSDCTGSGFRLATQPANCVITRTTPTDGSTRTATRANGTSHAVTIDTATPSGYDTSVTTSNAGVKITATSTYFASRTIAISGTHLVSKLDSTTLWDHTVSTDTADPISIVGTGAGKVISSGTVIVQHNIVKVTATTKVSSALAYTDANCCFPTTGELTTTFKGGEFDSKTESLSFGSECGEATLVNSAGKTSEITLSECL